ncbi:hypothetical protein RJ640_007562 [Escallonia rubra]|uniref:Protein kinase domain-containing protein n=1 Tax=Escallonia rubra TaxID=112253 RepID=A0AA88RL69_9ASTE|nr:hypothetical protein RJ640_007562 [Escallonia rubra]
MDSIHHFQPCEIVGIVSKDHTSFYGTSIKKIILNIAQGLAYHHEEYKSRIIHLDIKPQNSLMDENFNAKLFDFGLAKLMDRDQGQVMTQMRGTHGYMDPKWLSRKITEEADVYSFEVVMLEVVCWEDKLRLLCTRRNYQKEKAKTNKKVELIDKYSVDLQRHEENVVEITRTSIWCLYIDHARRSSISTVVNLLVTRGSASRAASSGACGSAESFGSNRLDPAQSSSLAVQLQLFNKR